MLSTDAVPPRERFSFWRETMQRVACPLTVTEADGELSGTLLARPLDRLTILDSSASGHGLIRGGTDIARGAVESYFIFQQLGSASSAFRAAAADEPSSVASGDIFIGDADEPFEAWSRGFQQRRVWVVPRALVSVDGAGESRLGQGLYLRSGEGLTQVLSAYLTELHRQAGALAAGPDALLAENVGRLIAAAGAGPQQAPEESHASLTAARLSFVRKAVDERVADPLLSPARIAAACGISTRKVHALFEPTGETFCQYLMRRRLAAARAALASEGWAAGSVTQIAFAHGFNSLATFYRAYQAAYGETPGATLDAGRLRA
jgi:AraC-like DNA-binding protein